MKTFTQIVLPIVIVIGIVFGITVVMNYSGPGADRRGDDVKLVAGHDVLKFSTLVARADPNIPQMKNWPAFYEIDQHGHFDFWFRNFNEKPVHVKFMGANCACGGADIFIVPEVAWSEYMTGSAIAAWPGLPASPLLAVANMLQFEAKLEKKLLAEGSKKEDVIVPAAPSSDRPQLAMLRFNWKGKEPESPKTLTADVTAQLEGQTASALHFESHFSVVPPFEIFSPALRGRMVPFGEIAPFSSSQRDVYFWSRTQPVLPITLAAESNGNDRDSVTWDTPVALSRPEIAQLAEMLPESPGADAILSASRVRVTVWERREMEKDGRKFTHHTDVGPLEFAVRATLQDGRPNLYSNVVYGNGLIRGDIRILGSPTGDVIDFGQSFPNNSPRSVQVDLVAERGDLDLELVAAECTPSYLQVDLKPIEGMSGQKRWRLRVAIPADKLFGQISGSFIILKTKEDPPRRVRIPVRATAHESSR